MNDASQTIALRALDLPRRVFVLGLLALTLAGLTAHAAHAGLGLADGFDGLFGWIYDAVLVTAALSCLARAAFVPVERAAWALVGVAGLAYAAGFLTYEFLVMTRDPIPYPSISDGLWLSFYPLLYVALGLLLRRRVTEFHPSLWLDGFIAAATLAAVGATLVGPVLSVTGGNAAAIATAMAYPVGALVLIGFVGILFAATGWRPGRGLSILAAALLVQVSADLIYLYQVTAGGWTPGTLLDDSWLLVGLLLAIAPWFSRPAVRPRAFEGDGLFAFPAAFSAVAVSMLVYAGLADVSPLPILLAGAALMIAAVRLLLTLHESRSLAVLAKRDGLTGLLNHREFHAAVERELANAERSDGTLALVLFDLDGFKRINDTRGHAEGDRILLSVATLMRRVCRSSDYACRVGGDEFGLVLPGGTHELAIRIADRVQATVIELDADVGVSYGLATWPEDGPTKELLLLRADVELYARKGVTRDGAAAAGGDAPRSTRAATAVARELEREQLKAYAHDLRGSYVRELQRTRELHENYLATVRTLAAAVDAKDDYTGGHIHRVHDLGLLLAKVVAPEAVDDPQLAYGFLLHDIGKLGVPDAVLLKPGRLTADEWAMMKRHPEIGAEILANVPFLDEALRVVRHHHERWDGGGYPNGLRGEEIPLWARIFAVVDTVDAMTSERPYQRARPLDDALAEVLANAGKQFDPVCARAFVKLDRTEIQALLQRCPRPEPVSDTTKLGIAS